MAEGNPLRLRFSKLDRPLIEPEPGGRVLCPRAVGRDGGSYRLYFMEHGACCPPGVKGVIVSAVSKDGERWTREPGVRLGPVPPRGSSRMLAPDVVRLPDRTWRMYAEARSDDAPSVILSARSDDGVDWTPEPGIRLADSEGAISYGTPNCVALPEGGWRLYCHARTSAGTRIVSARSPDGLAWSIEDGTRIGQTRPEEAAGAYSPFTGRDDDGWWMAYAGWSAPPEMHGRILAAESRDGLEWIKQAPPMLEPGIANDARHCSEPSLLRLPEAWLLLYEACDTGNAWRILAARSECL